MISRENLLAFIRKWLADFIAATTSSLNLMAIIAALLTLFGLALTAPKFQAFAMLFLVIFLLIIAIRTRPELHLHPANFVSQKLDVDRLDSFLVKIDRVGLIGKQNVGKTTFLDLTVARSAADQQTERPYAQIVALPNTSPIRYVAIIDSVGQRDYIQFEIQNHSDVILLFLDHSESTTEDVVEGKRIEQELYFCSQLIAAKQPNSGPRNIILVMNKSDLWAESSDALKKVDRFLDKAVSLFRASGKYEKVDVVKKYSNHNPADASVLLAKIREYHGA